MSCYCFEDDPSLLVEMLVIVNVGLVGKIVNKTIYYLPEKLT